MDIEMFIHFPGILITIGAGLLLASLIFGILAYKKEKNEVGANLLSNEIPSPEDFDEKPPIKKEEPVMTEEKSKEEEVSTFAFPSEEEIEEIKTAPIPVINEVVNTTKEVETPINEQVIEQPVRDEIKEEKPLEQTSIEDNIVIEETPIKEDLVTEERPVEEKTTRIYGGVEPTKQFNFTFNKEKGMYEDSKKPSYNIEDALSSQKIEVEQPVIEKTQIKEEPKVLNNFINSDDDEDIEVL